MSHSQILTGKGIDPARNDRFSPSFWKVPFSLYSGEH